MQKDKFNRPLTPGSLVIYGIRSGNSGGVRYGLVLKSDIDNSKTSWEQRVMVFNGNGSISRPSTASMIMVSAGTFPEEVEKELNTEWSKRSGEKNVSKQ